MRAAAIPATGAGCVGCALLQLAAIIHQIKAYCNKSHFVPKLFVCLGLLPFFFVLTGQQERVFGVGLIKEVNSVLRAAHGRWSPRPPQDPGSCLCPSYAIETRGNTVGYGGRRN